MSEKTWIKDSGGMYTVAPSRGARAGETVYKARIWIKSRQDFAHFDLGLTLKQAQRKMREILGNPEAALVEREVKKQATTSITFDELADRFLAGYESRGGVGTAYYRDRLKQVRAFLGKWPIATIASDDLDDYRKMRVALTWKDGSRRVEDSTIRKDLVCLGTVFGWAKEKKLLTVNIADDEHIKRPQENGEEGRELTDDELQAVREKSAPWLDNVIGWATETGLDKGKVLRLRWDELNLERLDGRIAAGRFKMVRGKTGVVIRQVLSAGAIEVLNRAARTRHASGIVFLDAGAQPIAERSLDWSLGCVYKAAKITGCNFRTFRHTYATRALRRGVPREVVAITMGHSTAYITSRYMHVADDQLEAAAAAMSGPVRLTGRDRMAGGSVTVPPGAPPGIDAEAETA